jgi:hypothetical protein
VNVYVRPSQGSLAGPKTRVCRLQVSFRSSISSERDEYRPLCSNLRQCQSLKSSSDPSTESHPSLVTARSLMRSVGCKCRAPFGTQTILTKQSVAFLSASNSLWRPCQQRSSLQQMALSPLQLLLQSGPPLAGPAPLFVPQIKSMEHFTEVF